MTLKERLVKLSYEKPELRASLAAIIKQADSIFTFDVAIPYRITVENILALEPDRYLYKGYVIGPGLESTSFELVANQVGKEVSIEKFNQPTDTPSLSLLKALMEYDREHLYSALLSKLQTEHFASLQAES